MRAESAWGRASRPTACRLRRRARTAWRRRPSSLEHRRWVHRRTPRPAPRRARWGARRGRGWRPSAHQAGEGVIGWRPTVASTAAAAASARTPAPPPPPGRPATPPRPAPLLRPRLRESRRPTKSHSLAVLLQTTQTLRLCPRRCDRRTRPRGPLARLRTTRTTRKPVPSCRDASTNERRRRHVLCFGPRGLGDTT